MHYFYTWGRGLLERFRLGSMHTTLCLAALVGCLGALSTVAFRETLEQSERLLFGHTVGLVKAAALLPCWERILIPTLGGLLAGAVLEAASRFQSDEAIDYMEAISRKHGTMNIKVVLIRVLSSILSIASGSSIGREGSMIQVSSLTGCWVGKAMPVSAPIRRLLLACGAAAGITAAYNAPIAGALFVSEIVFRSIAIESLGPLIVASVVSNLTIHLFLGYKPVYEMPHFSLMYNSELILHALLGIGLGLIAPLFLNSLDYTKTFFRRILPSVPWRLATGGLIVGLLSLIHPEVWGNGYSVVNDILGNAWAWQALLFLVLTKVAATIATAGSGAIGGILTPSLFVGAALGFIFGEGAHAIWPTLAPSPVYAAIGMAAFLSATIYAPLTAMLMIFEMTGQYAMMLPVMLASVLAYSTANLQRQRSCYSDSLKANRSFSDIRLTDILHQAPPTLEKTDLLYQFEEQFILSRWQHVYVRDAQNCFLGAVSLHDLRPLLQDRSLLHSHLPESLIKYDYPRLYPDMTPGKVLEVFARHPGERLPLIDPQHNNKLLGFIAKTDLMLLLQESIVE
jgi:chloride channel protein, CIC family